MPTSPVHGVLDHVRRAALREQDAARTDGELLTRFLSQRDEAAFEALVRRHGPMILGVCRRVLRSEADAEDAFQATFLVLIRKAASIRPRERAANWLYGVAFHTAQKAWAAALKRRAKERRAGEMHRPDAPDDRWEDLLPVLDRELHRLPERYRIPIVLCELKGKTHKEAARQLGWPVGTVSGRLSRGRAELARRMKRQGASPQEMAPAVVPPALTVAAVKAATAFTAGSAAVAVSAKVIALAEGTVKTMLLTKLKAVTAVLLAVALAGAGAAVAWASMPGKEGRAPMNADATQGRPEKAAELAAPDPDEKAVREYVAELRAAAKNPTDDHQVYRLVIRPMFHKAVVWAAKHGEDALVVELYADYSGSTPIPGGTSLTWAAASGDLETVKILLGRGVDVKAGDSTGCTALHQAAHHSPEIVRLLLEKGADANARDRWGNAPLMNAAGADRPEMMRLLLDHKADVNAANDDGRTPLMVAAEHGRLENAQLLLSQDADARMTDKKGATALTLVKPASSYVPGFITPEQAQEHQEQVKRDAEALRRILEKAGGRE